MPQDPTPRVGFASHRFQHVGTVGMAHTTLYGLLVDSKIGFDEIWRLGTCFANLNIRNQSEFFMMYVI
jgi:hypothetical protein